MTELFAQQGGGGLTFLIYLAIAVIWIVGKFMQQKEAQRKVEELKRRREERGDTEPTTSTTRKTIEDELQEFLGRMAGLDPEPAPPPPPPKPPPLPKSPPPIQFDQAPPPPTPARKTPVRSVRPTLGLDHELPPGGKSSEEVYARIADIEDIKEISLDGTVDLDGALMSIRTLMVDMSRSNIPLQRIKMPTMQTVTTRTDKPNLNNRSVLKQAVVGRILLEPPKALKPNPFSMEG